MFAMDTSGCLNDNSIGPDVRGCRDDFDFTLKFERVVLSIVPAAVFIALAFARIAYLLRTPQTVGGVWFKFVKLVCAPDRTPWKNRWLTKLRLPT